MKVTLIESGHVGPMTCAYAEERSKCSFRVAPPHSAVFKGRGLFAPATAAEAGIEY